MTVWSVDKNPEAKRMVITAEFTASIANVWQLWADPRLLERWWGPPGFPATFVQHDLTPGGTITYFMAGADGGDRFDGTWSVVEVDAPTRLVVEDAIVDDDGTPSDGNSMTRMEIDIEGAGDTTRMILTTHFDSLVGMEQAIATGVVEGMQACMTQIDAVLAELTATAASSAS
ncbi:MAG: SRPBCC domain-containing protein [Acidimicrobiia bacterium]